MVHCAKYQSFLKHCCQCRNQLQQTELSFLSPPSSRNKCRYFNVERLVNWAEKLFNCQVDTLAKLVPNLAPESLIKKLCWKFGWLIDYQEELQIWSQMIQMTRTVETQLKNHGIARYSLSHLNFMNAADWNNSCVDFRQHIVNYLATEIAKIPVGKTLLATSDVIESIFGKYKQFSTKCPIRQLGQMVLRISLATMNLTHSVVKKALETVGYKELQSWSFQVFGQSMLGKRKTVFALDNNDTEYVRNYLEYLSTKSTL